jgi:excisionase family DNA binding protein
MSPVRDDQPLTDIFSERGPMNPECMTVSVEEAGKTLGCSRNTAYEAVRRGEIPVIRIGKLLRVPKAALERLLSGAGPKGDGA